MKACEYCGRTVADTVEVCPSCMGVNFKPKCNVCGTVYDGPTCPVCAEAARKAKAEAAEEERLAQEAAEREREEQVKVENANSGIWWKIALTIFFPFVGGYLIISPRINNRYVRYFGIGYCLIMALGLLVTGKTWAVRIFGLVSCLLPILVYLFRTRDKWVKKG